MLAVAIASFISLYAGQSLDGLSMEKIVKNKSDIKTENKKIQLFIYSDCYYCIKVTAFLQEHNLLNEIDLVDTYLPENRSWLRQISGKTQAPYLVDSDVDVKMPESLDIITYFTHKFDISI